MPPRAGQRCKQTKAEQAENPSPFEFTRLALEREWNAPYVAWTRQQHQEHTRRIYHLLGWGDAAIEEPQVGRLYGSGVNTKMILPRRAS